MHPARNSATQPMAIPQAFVTHRPYFKQYRRVSLHNPANTRKPPFRVLHHIRECQRLPHEPPGPLTRRLKHDQGPVRRRLRRQDQRATRQPIEEEHRCPPQRRLDRFRSLHCNRPERRQPSATASARPRKSMVRPAIRSPPDLLDDHRRVSCRTAARPLQMNTPPSHVRAHALRRHVPVHSRDSVGIPTQVCQNTQNITTRATRPRAHWRLRIPTNHEIKGDQPCPESLGSTDNCPSRIVPHVRNPARGCG